jgi:hypothetical protein
MVKTAEHTKSAFVTEQDGYQLTVNLTPDQMVAYLTIAQLDKEASFRFSVDDLTAVLAQAGVVHGVKKDQLGQIIANVPLNKRQEVARGLPPEKGKDAEFEIMFDTKVDKSPVVGPDGLIDYKNLNLIRNAKAGQQLARKIPALRGQPGMTVTGADVDGLLGKDRPLPKGKNTNASEEDPNVLVATESGAIMSSNGIISIEKVYKLNKDVDISTGNLSHAGNLQITGGVKAGFIVKAEGNIEISKNVEDAEVISNASIVISGGFIGSGNGYLKAKDDVYVKFVENGRIEAGNDINIGGVALNSQIEAGNAICLKGKKAVILGGQATALNMIETDSIGSDLETKTIVKVGYSPTILKEYQQLDSEIKRLKSDFERIKQALYSLVRLEMDDKLSEAQLESLTRLKSCRNEIPLQLETMENAKKELLTKLGENKNAKIVVKGTAYHGSIIQIGALKREIVNEISNCTFRVVRDQIVTVTHN